MTNIDSLEKNSPMDQLLAQDVVENLSDFRALQGVPLSPEQAERINVLQENTRREALVHGFDQLNALENGNEVSAVGPYLQKISILQDQLLKLNHYSELDSLSGDLYIEDLKLINKGLSEVIELAHKDAELSDRDVVAAEYIGGLLRSSLAVHVGRSVALIMTKKWPDTFSEPHIQGLAEQLAQAQSESEGLSFVEKLSDVSRADDLIVEIMNRAYEGNSEAYWANYNEALESKPELSKLSTALVSMQNAREDKARVDVIGFMQGAHWSGFGGNGALFDQIPDLDRDDVRKKRLGWHAEGEAFTDKLTHFKAAIGPLKNREAAVVGELAEELFAHKDAIDIFDSGAGAAARGSHGIAGKLEALGKTVTINASDVDGASIASLGKLSGKSPAPQLPQTKIGEIMYWDVNRPNSDVQADSTDIFVSSVVLHQVMDSTQGEDRVSDFLKSVTKMTREGGLFSWSDTGEKCDRQLQMIPFNVNDREGSVPADIFQRITFEDIAFAITKEDENDEQCYKIPYRLSDYRFATPVSIAQEHGSAIYEYNVFKIISVPAHVLHELDMTSDPKVRDEIVSEYLNPEQIGLKRSTVSEQVADIVK